MYVAKRGDRDPDAMRVADFWLTDKAQVHKLFKVLGPRFAQSNGPFTKLFKYAEPGERGKMTAYLEFKGNPYPPLQPTERKNPKWLINVLLEGARHDFHSSGLAEKVDSNITNRRDLNRLSQSMIDMKLTASVEGATASVSDTQKDNNELKNEDGTPV